MADRGVFEVPFPDADGARLFYCVDRHGVRRRTMEAYPGERPVITATLWRHLDAVDPTPQKRPRLQVVEVDR